MKLEMNSKSTGNENIFSEYSKTFVKESKECIKKKTRMVTEHNNEHLRTRVETRFNIF